LIVVLNFTRGQKLADIYHVVDTRHALLSRRRFELQQFIQNLKQTLKSSTVDLC